MVVRTKKQKLEDRKRKDEEWARHLRKKQKHPSRLRTGKPLPYSKRFSEITASYQEVNDGNNNGGYQEDSRQGQEGK